MSAALTQALSALRMQRRRTKPLRGGPTTPSPMGIEWLDTRPRDAPEGPFGLTQGPSRGCVDVEMLSARGRDSGSPYSASRGRSLLDQVEQVGADVLGPELFGRGAKVLREIGDPVDVESDRLGRQVVEDQVLPASVGQDSNLVCPSMTYRTPRLLINNLTRLESCPTGDFLAAHPDSCTDRSGEDRREVSPSFRNYDSTIPSRCQILVPFRVSRGQFQNSIEPRNTRNTRKGEALARIDPPSNAEEGVDDGHY